MPLPPVVLPPRANRTQRREARRLDVLARAGHLQQRQHAGTQALTEAWTGKWYAFDERHRVPELRETDRQDAAGGPGANYANAHGNPDKRR